MAENLQKFGHSDLHLRQNQSIIVYEGKSLPLQDWEGFSPLGGADIEI